MAAQSSDPAVTIHRRGLLSLNLSAFSALARPGAVELLFDRRASIVGLRAIALTAANAVYVRPASRSPSGPWIVSALAFLRYYGVDLAVARRWPARLDDGVLCLDLAGPSTIVTGNRRRQDTTGPQADPLNGR